MSLIFLETFPPAAEHLINGLENQLGRPIPPDYRRFLATQNGGQPEANGLRSNLNVGVSLFLGVGHAPNSYYDISRTLEVYKDRIPSGFLPVVSAEGGNLVCISLNAPDYGHLYFWDHELEAEEWEPATMENMQWVAPDFRTFFDDLMGDEEMTARGL